VFIFASGIAFHIRSVPPDEVIASIDHPAPLIYAQAVVYLLLAPAAGEVAPDLDRRRRERGLRGDICPDRLDNSFEYGSSHMAAGRTASQRTTLCVGIIVADPDRNRYVVGESNEPSVVLIVRGTGLSGNIGRKICQRSGRASCQDSLQHGLELIEGSRIYRSNRRGCWLITVKDVSVALDRLQYVRNGK